MILNVSESAGNVMLDALARQMDGGSIELLDASGRALAELSLSVLAAKSASGGELIFNRIAEGTAAHAGAPRRLRALLRWMALQKFFPAMSAPRNRTR